MNGEYRPLLFLAVGLLLGAEMRSTKPEAEWPDLRLSRQRGQIDQEMAKEFVQ